MNLTKRLLTTTIAGLLLASAAMAAKPPKPIKVYIVAGQSNAEDRQSVGWLTENFPEYTKPRNDVWRMRPGIQSPTPLMGPKYKVFGVEHATGYILGDAVDNDILFIRSAVGGTMLYDRWRSPSAVKRLGGPVGDLYNTMIKRVHNTLANLEQFLPTYRGQGYELAGVIWFQGENDCCAKTQGYYRDGLMDLIADTRRDLGVPNLPFAIVKINDGCWGPPAVDIWAAEEYAAHAEKNVVTVVSRDTRSLCHYDQQSYITIGQRLGKALLPFAKTTVHTGDEEIRAAAKAFFARTTTPGKPQDMKSLRRGLVGHWKFDDGQGTNVASAIADGVTGRNYVKGPGAGEWVKGKFGKAVKLSGKQAVTFNNFALPTNADGKIEQFSIAFWARTPGGASSYRIGRGTGQPIQGKLGPDNWYISQNANRTGWDVRGFDNGHATLTGMVTDANGKPATFAALAADSFGGDGIEWRHQAYVFDLKAGEVRFYTNGEHIATKKTTAPPAPSRRNPNPTGQVIGAILPADAGTPLMIGGIELVDMDFDFCVYDELAIWSRPITDEEVTTLYNGGAGSEIIVTEPLKAKSTAELAKILADNPDATIRYDAVMVLADRAPADDRAQSLIIQAMTDRSWGVRYGAAMVLGEQGRNNQAMALAMLQSKNDDQRVLATVILRYMGRKVDPAKVVPDLIKALGDPFFDVRTNAARALGALGDWATDAVPALLTATTDSEWWVRDEAHLALTAIRTPEARAGMIAALDRDMHAVTWFQTGAKLLAPIKADPALQEKLALAYGRWLCKGDHWTEPFASRGKFGYAVKGLQEMVEAKQPIPAEVGETIQRILDGKETPLWTIDDRANRRKALEDILAAIQNQSKGTK